MFQHKKAGKKAQTHSKWWYVCVQEGVQKLYLTQPLRREGTNTLTLFFTSFVLDS